MELTETIEMLNQRLVEHYGIDTSTSMPIWRVVWSEDQLEQRYGIYDDISPAGIFIRQVKETRLVPKYKQWIHQKFVLEQLVAVPIINVLDLPDVKVSYEPLWVFEGRNHNYLPPKWEPIKLIIDTVYAVKHGSHLARYKDPDSTQEEALELHKQKIDTIVEELFGDESGLMGTTITGETIIVPQNYLKKGNGEV